MENSNFRRISFMRELRLLLRQGILVLFGNRPTLIFSLVFPFAAAAITVWIAGENMFVNFENTKSACFLLTCAAIWGGLFNSIQSVVKERANIKRDYVSGALRIECYTISRALIQLALCIFQSAGLCLSFVGVSVLHGNALPESGLIFGSSLAEYYLTILLIMYAADTMGFLISCIVKNQQLAGQLAPYILIVELIFSGVLFAMEGAASAVSGIMLSRWGMEALGSTSDLNALPLKLQAEFPMLPHPEEEAFLHSAEHLTEVWLLLVLFVVVPLVIGNIALRGVKKDGRG